MAPCKGVPVPALLAPCGARGVRHRTYEMHHVVLPIGRHRFCLIIAGGAEQDLCLLIDD